MRLRGEPRAGSGAVRGRERGAGAVEYVGVITAAALLLAALLLVTPGLGGSVASGITRAICSVTSVVGASCPLQPEGPPASGLPTEEVSYPDSWQLTPEQKQQLTDYRNRQWTQAQLRSGRYTHLGDSYGAGEGAKDYGDTDRKGGRKFPKVWEEESKNMCHRSGNAAYHTVNDTFFGGNEQNTFGACSGATTQDYWQTNKDGNDEPPQRDRITPENTLVVNSMGGNDMGFAQILKSCIAENRDGCIAQYDNPPAPGEKSEWDKNAERLFGTEPGGGELGKVYRDIIQRSDGNAVVVIVGYPQLFEPDFDGWTLDNEKVTWMNGKAKELNDRLRAHAEFYGFVFVDPTEEFKDHGIGSDKPYVLNLGFGPHRAVLPEVYHPNAEGQKAISRAILKEIEKLP